MFLILTASVWIGWAANNAPAVIANRGWNPTTVKQTLVNKMDAVAWRMMLQTWNHVGWRPTMAWVALKIKSKKRVKLRWRVSKKGESFSLFFFRFCEAELIGNGQSRLYAFSDLSTSTTLIYRLLAKRFGNGILFLSHSIIKCGW